MTSSFTKTPVALIEVLDIDASQDQFQQKMTHAVLSANALSKEERVARLDKISGMRKSVVA